MLDFCVLFCFTKFTSEIIKQKNNGKLFLKKFKSHFVYFPLYEKRENGLSTMLTNISSSEFVSKTRKGIEIKAQKIFKLYFKKITKVRRGEKMVA